MLEVLTSPVLLTPNPHPRHKDQGANHLRSNPVPKPQSTNTAADAAPGKSTLAGLVTNLVM